MELKGNIRDADQAVKVGSLIKRYGEPVAVDGLSLRVPHGRVLGLLGPNGSGRTTTVSCILQLLTYDEGAIRVFGQPMTPTAYGLKCRIGVMPQDVAVFDELTVVEDINALYALYVHDRATRHCLVDRAIVFVGLEKFARFKLRKLSGGLLRRLNIACDIAHSPDPIILDELMIIIDLQGRNTILDGITCLSEQGATIIYASHYTEEVEQSCHRIVIMDHDRQVASGTSDELKAMIGAGERIRVEIADPVPLSEEAPESLRCLEHVRTTTYREPEIFVEYSPGAYSLSGVMGALAAAGATYGQVTSEPPTLNNVFLEITGQVPRDEAARDADRLPPPGAQAPA